jgi:hypothetical protein
LCSGLTRRGIDVRHDDLGAFFGKSFSRSPPNATAATRNEGNLAGKPWHAFLLTKHLVSPRRRHCALSLIAAL